MGHVYFSLYSIYGFLSSCCDTEHITSEFCLLILLSINLAITFFVSTPKPLERFSAHVGQMFALSLQCAELTFKQYPPKIMSHLWL